MTWEEAVLWLRSQPDQADLVRACFYDDPLLEAAARYHGSTEWKAVRQLLPAHRGRALDIGAGRGIASFALARDGWTVAAAEPDPSPIVGAAAIRSLFQEACLPIEIREESGERLPFADESFDLVFGRAVMHHASNLLAFCREVRRVMRPSGIFVCAREHVLSRREDLPRFLAEHPLHRHYGGERAYVLREYLGAIREAGLEPMGVLNPLASDVNLYPDTLDALRERLALKFRLPSAKLVPVWLLAAAGRRLNHPGRLYTFVCRRGHRAAAPDAIAKEES